MTGGTLELAADVDGDGTAEQAVFELRGNLDITQSIRTGYLIGGRQSNVESIIANLVADGVSKRKQFFLDLGAGGRTWDIEFTTWKGAQDESGSPLQWGNTGDESQLTAGDATGARALDQMEVFFEYLAVGTIDSTSPATFTYGQHTPSGLYSPVDVVLESPTIKRVAEDGDWVDGSMTLIDAAAVSDVYDADKKQPY